MNRRAFFLGAAAGIALIGPQAYAQRREQRSSVLTSELTGGKIHLADTELEVADHYIDAADGSEHIHFAGEGGQLELVFWPHSSGDAVDFVDNTIGMFTAASPNTEVLGSDTFEDGGWIAINADALGYFEYQLGAYDDHDLILTLVSPMVTFVHTYEQAQAILVDGMSPFLISEESEIVALAAERATSTTSSRAGRSSHSSSSQDAGGDPVHAVRAHRRTFQASYEEFWAKLPVSVDKTLADSEQHEARTFVVEVAFEWRVYPVDASKVIFSPDLSRLESIYLAWAGAISDLGFAFEDLLQGRMSIDDFLSLDDTWNTVDDELVAILESLGYRPNPRATRPVDTASAMQVVYIAA